MQIFASTTFLGPGRTGLEDALDALEPVNLDGIELGSTHLWSAGFEEALKKRQQSRFFTHNYFPPAREDLIVNLASTDSSVRTASLKHAKFCLDFAAEIGAEIYTVHPGFLAEPDRTSEIRSQSGYDFVFSAHKAPRDEAFRLMVDSIRELAEHASRKNVALAIETEGSVTEPGVLMLEQPREMGMLFSAIPEGLSINLNLAHTLFAAEHYGFSVEEFIARWRDRIVLVEISHNDGNSDQHLPLTPGSPMLEWIHFLPDVPYVLEFRDSNARQLAESSAQLRNSKSSSVKE